ncbi:DUF1836 domain-containing protein [Bacillus sp. 2205SS5-2]|uniref:DUF1836 domain-containing protein n=1 Tax=Bacillus sp. 2205SS5-2 TaxID=3109031 RepID=UPI003005AFC2
METYKLTRKNLADLLLSLKYRSNHTPHIVLEEVWATTHLTEENNEQTFPSVLSTNIPPIIKKIIKTTKAEIGFSLNEIVSLGNLVEFTSFSQSTVQNWVKRDVKGLIGSPQLGKKYTIEQTAMLFIVEDLKATLDFESIRKILTLVFNDIDDSTDDIVNPTDLYAAYSSVFDKIHHLSFPRLKDFPLGPVNEMILHFIKEECQNLLASFEGVLEEDLIIVLNVLILSVSSVQATYYQSATKKYVESAVLEK